MQLALYPRTYSFDKSTVDFLMLTNLREVHAKLAAFESLHRRLHCLETKTHLLHGYLIEARPPSSMSAAVSASDFSQVELLYEK